jgi:hypothetical protein
MKYLFILLFGCFLVEKMDAQKYLQIEKRNTTKVRRFMEGDVITYKIKGKEEPWHTDEIQRIVVENGILIMPNGMVKISDIDRLRFERYWTDAYKKSMYAFGGGWAFWNIVGTILKEETLEKGDAIVVGSSIASGFLVRKIFKYRIMKMGAKRRLRVIDLDFMTRK